MNDLMEKDFDDVEVYCRFCLKVDEEKHLCIVKQCEKCGQYEYDCVCWYDECHHCLKNKEDCNCTECYYCERLINECGCEDCFDELWL